MGTTSLPLYSLGQNSHKTYPDLRGRDIEPYLLMEGVSDNWPSLICLIFTLAFDIVHHKWYDFLFLGFSLISDYSSLVSFNGVFFLPLLECPLPFPLSILICPRWSYLLLWLQSPSLGWWFPKSLNMATLIVWLTWPRNLHNTHGRCLNNLCVYPLISRATSLVLKAAGSSLYGFPENLLLPSNYTTLIATSRNDVREWQPRMP